MTLDYKTMQENIIAENKFCIENQPNTTIINC